MRPGGLAASGSGRCSSVVPLLKQLLLGRSRRPAAESVSRRLLATGWREVSTGGCWRCWVFTGGAMLLYSLYPRLGYPGLLYSLAVLYCCIHWRASIGIVSCTGEVSTGDARWRGSRPVDGEVSTGAARWR